MKNATKIGLFAVHKIVSEYSECISTFRRIRRYLSAYGKNPKRILPYSPNTPRDIKLSLTQFSTKAKNISYLRSSTYTYIGSNGQKTISRCCASIPLRMIFNEKLAKQQATVFGYGPLKTRSFTMPCSYTQTAT